MAMNTITINTPHGTRSFVDAIEAAIYMKAFEFDFDYSTLDLSDLELRYVDHLSADECLQGVLADDEPW
jgi:hypothetical protein